MTKIEPGCNRNKRTVPIRYDCLAPLPGPEKVRRRDCPACGEGLLLLSRDWKTGRLQPEDRCTLCGQRFLFLDIDELRAQEGG
jgi:predicted RNA-binding Zn-ribbon protein involved in translation (DUF1610 family)